MIGRCVVLLACSMLVFGFSREALALYNTPKSDVGIVLHTLAWNPVISPDAAAQAIETMDRQGYFTQVIMQTYSLDDFGGAKDFVIALQEQYGALAMVAHGVSDSIDATRNGLPTFGYFGTLDSAVVSLNWLINHGYVDNSPGNIEAVATGGPVYIGQDGFGNPMYVLRYWLELTNQGLERISQPQRAIIYGVLCDGALRAQEWITNGTGVFVGYGFNCPVDLGEADLDKFWERLGGLAGRTNRTAKQAKSALPLATITPASAGDSLVLAAWLIDVAPPQITPPFLITGGDKAYAQFDTKMHATQTSATATIRVDGQNLEFYQTPHWVQDTTSTGNNYSYIEYMLSPRAGGIGTLSVLCSQSRSEGGIMVNSGVAHPQHTRMPGDTIVYVYATAEVPIAVGISRIAATTGGNGALISFETMWEQEADSFTVERLTGTGAVALTKFPSSGTGGPGYYSYLDPSGGTGARYRIVEHQSGALPDLRYEVFEAGPAPSLYPSEPVTYDPDSLAEEIDALGNPGIVIETGGIPGRYVIIAPDDLCADLGAYRQAWQLYGGESPDIVPISETFLQGGIKGYLEWAHFYHTDYALLVGDANDAAWWDNSSKWINGWKYPRVSGTGAHIPSQPTQNVIPTFYKADAAPPSVAMSFYTPYYASDLPYADTDDDGLPNLRLGRLPAHSRDDVIAYTQKLRAYLAGSSSPSGGDRVVMTCARDNGRAVGRFIEEDANAVIDELGGSVPSVTATNDSIWTFERREEVADSVANTDPDLIFWLSSGAQRDIYANFWRLDQGWSVAQLQPPGTPGKFFVSLGFACGMANFDQTEDYTWCDSTANPTYCTGPIRPIAERLLLDAQRGAITVVGPTRGTFEYGNVLFAREMARHLAVAGRDMGTAFMLAQAGSMTKYPGYTDLFRSYVLLGDPLLGGPTVTGVAGHEGVLRPGLSRPRPNPFNPVTTLNVTVAVGGIVHLRVYDASGRLVRTLIDGEVYRPGTSAVRWDGKNEAGNAVGSGIYFAQMETGGSSYRQKLVLLK